jgi:hypothetical protein
MTVRCGSCQRRARVVEVNDHGRLFYALDCPRCGLHIPHAPSRQDRAPRPATNETCEALHGLAPGIRTYGRLSNGSM